jgi:hydroxypyruvate isomerase
MRAAEAEAEAPAVKRGFRQSVVRWCYEKHWSLEEQCVIAKRLGISSVELVPPETWPVLKKHGLVCAIASSHGFDRGMNDPANWPECTAKMRQAIDACAEWGFPNVITFTGFRNGIPDDVGQANCVKGFKEFVGYAERKKVTLCLEILNSRDPVEMKGHPGYQGDHADYCFEILRQVGSPRLKLLFDIYHVQIMDGDIIRRLRAHKEWIGHFHTAGNPGRHEIDGRQEINYRPIFEEIARLGLDAYVAHEFIPTRDPLAGLEEAVKLATV